MRKNLVKKGLAVVIIILFVCMSITPSSGNIMSYDDTTPPVTTHTLDPPEPDGLNGWYVNDVAVTLNATDDMSGINTTYYSVNSEPWEIYNEPFILSEDGPHHLVYFSVDNAGNMEFPKLAHLKMDQTPPKLKFTAEGKGRRPTLYTYIAVATDETSGMERAEFYLNNGLEEKIIGPGPIYSWETLAIPTPDPEFKVIVYDYAGLSESDIYKGYPPVNSFFSQFLERFPLIHKLITNLF